MTGIISSLPEIKLLTGFLIFIVLLIGSALISGSEVAYFSLRPEDIEKLKSNKSRKALTALKLYSNPEKLLSTILVANNTINIAIVLLAAFLSSILFDFSEKPVLGFIINIITITFILLFFGEVMPKVYSSRVHVRMVILMAIPLSVIEIIFKPVTSLLILSTFYVKKRAGSSRTNISMDDLSDALELASDDMDEDEKLLKGIVNFGNINVSAIMCPRIDVTALNIKSGFDTVVPKIVESGFSRIPVYSGSFDSVKGILYAKDILPFTGNPANFKWQSLLRPPYFVPETKKINDLLKEFQTKKIHMAIVIDEYGGTSGIVTLEDILEEIVGEITDESDEDPVLFKKLDEKTFIFDGKIMVNDFCKIINTEEDYFESIRGESETLAGLILELTGEIPQKGQSVTFRQFSFSVEAADRRRIKEIRVEIKQDEADAAED
ncbi:MAG TPA: hemolysin [Bacteroidales bacterium]|nr:hemolysin [Bacteroidales bacterium]HBH85638.1 hemolysin [Bacteroidales bacterium]HBQ83326.1 hemolysin [Bacteroidales bacterium]HCU19795.1 hemolysin [Bacteroidales bacterium]